jgi:hypothetical protein
MTLNRGEAQQHLAEYLAECDAEEFQDPECSSCSGNTRDLHWTRPHTNQGDRFPPDVYGGGYFLCDYCYATRAGTAFEYPQQHPEDGPILRHVCSVAHILERRLLDALSKLIGSS